MIVYTSVGPYQIPRKNELAFLKIISAAGAIFFFPAPKKAKRFQFERFKLKGILLWVSLQSPLPKYVTSEPIPPYTVRKKCTARP